MMKLTEKQRRFCLEYPIDLNATQAAIRAGYSPRSANRTAHVLLTKESVRELINTRIAEIDDDLMAKGDEVLKYLTSVMRGDDIEQTVVVADGVANVESYVDQRNRLKAAELLAKCHGLMVQRVDATGDVSVTFVDDLEDDEGG